MSTTTTNYNLVKPEYTDVADIADINGNMDIIDAKMKETADDVATNTSAISGLTTDVGALDTTVSGHTTSIASLSLTKQDALTKGTVAENTGLNSVTDAGYYWLNSTYGNMPHTGTASGVLEVVKVSEAVLMQRYTRFQGADYAITMIFYRLRVNNVWYNWKTALVVS